MYVWNITICSAQLCLKRIFECSAQKHLWLFPPFLKMFWKLEFTIFFEILKIIAKCFQMFLTHKNFFFIWSCGTWEHFLIFRPKNCQTFGVVEHWNIFKCFDRIIVEHLELWNIGTFLNVLNKKKSNLFWKNGTILNVSDKCFGTFFWFLKIMDNILDQRNNLKCFWHVIFGIFHMFGTI